MINLIMNGFSLVSSNEIKEKRGYKKKYWKARTFNQKVQLFYNRFNRFVLEMK